MSSLTRKKFLQTSAVLAASFLTGTAFVPYKREPLLSFSTLGCPDWTFDQIISFAKQQGYKGIELRGLQRQMDLTRCPEFSTAEARAKTMAAMKAKGLQFVNLGSSANLHQPEGEERQKNLAEAQRFIDLAQQIKCPYVRVFPNNLPKEREKKETLALISNGLKELGQYAHGKGVMVLMETHGDVVWIEDLAHIMKSVNHSNVGLVWDVSNMWTITKEPPADAYQKLKKYIRHTHIKDALFNNGKLQYTLLGQGSVPVEAAIKALQKDGFKGYYSFEWEKLWHPEIAEPEVALAHYPSALKQLLKKI